MQNGISKIKTICTIGPATGTAEMIEKLIVTGMDIARFNMSHKSYEEFLEQQRWIKEYSILHGKDVKILVDLQGPRMRVGAMPEEGIPLTEGQEVVFTTDSANKEAMHINDPYLHQDIAPNHPLYLANGDLELLVTKVDGNEITAKVVRGGILHSRKGVNVPDTSLTTRGLTDKDVQDVQFAVEQGAEMIAMSFVKDAEDLRNLRSLIGNDNIGIVPKIEIKQALLNIDEIIQESDIVMVARGDLGIEVPLYTLPLIQKDIIRRCKVHGVPAIVATQMLMSMTDHHRPTRAEVSDVANAVIDGADYVMLSDETAFGKYPIQALDYLIKTAQHTKDYLVEQELANV